MRLFATGLMSRVMNASFPDDMPLESKMVSKAVERAQGTVEDRNFEIRKNVLKYDEVMNEQRKIIYRRRQQILDGEDLELDAIQAIESALSRLVEQHCLGEFFEDWDVPGLLDAARLYYPTRITKEQIDEILGREALEAAFVDDAKALYEEKGELIGVDTLRDIERRVMLSVIDQHWREHLYEMDYLQEGINLRAMGQQDPLSEWQREGFDMFEAMMGQIEDDFVRYVFHLQVVVDEEPRPDIRNISYSAPVDPVQGSSSIEAAMAAQAAEMPLSFDPDDEAPMALPTEQVQQQPVRAEKTPGRNEPCFCGSGKKYKLCHGR
jgi:preprotein translocase subunit SecA